MKSWDDLTEAGQFRRLRTLATAAIEQYPVTPTRLQLVGGFTNAIFRVDALSGTYALRVDLLQDHSDTDVDIELAWLAALNRETDLDVVRPVLASDGSTYVYADAAGVPGPRRCVLFDWVPGKPLAARLSPAAYHELGVMSARLHLHGAAFTPPARPMAWDKVFYWPEDVDPYVLDEPGYAHHFDGERRTILDRAIVATTAAFQRLPANQSQIVHGDLHPWNVHQRRGRLYALDFEDVMWAHPVQDIAITLFYERDNTLYPALRSAFEEGYRSVAAWPSVYDGEIEHFMAARTLMFVNFILNLGDDPSEFYAIAFGRLTEFLNRWT